jgi:CPA2 family monovalent cation:H+ antiporter-2
VATLLVLLGFATKTCGGFLAGRSVGHSPRLSLVVGLSLVPKGEFSIVLAAMAAAVAHPDTRIETLTGVYVFALSILGPVAMREADRLADLLLARRRGQEGAETSPEST